MLPECAQTGRARTACVHMCPGQVCDAVMRIVVRWHPGLAGVQQRMLPAIAPALLKAGGVGYVRFLSLPPQTTGLTQ